MRSSLLAWAMPMIAVAKIACAAPSLASVCTADYVEAHLPAAGTFLGITIDSSSVSAVPVYNNTVTGNVFYPDLIDFNYCYVSFSYSHNGLDDNVVLTYWVPEPALFQNRYLTTGGGGTYAINSGNMSLPSGIQNGAVAGITDGGFGIFQDAAIEDFLLANGTRYWHKIYMFGYEAIHEMSEIGKFFTKTFFNMTETTKLYSYYQACSEGGREGWSQVQRFAKQFDGAAIGAPAFRFAFQQVQHLYSNVVEKTLDYFPPPCELQKIVDETIIACDPLDGRTDGVVSRTDLCTMHYDISAVEGMAYNCSASAGSSSSPATPAQTGTVSASAIAVAKKIFEGLHNSKGERVYFTYTPSSTFTDAQTAYNATSGTWELSVTSLGGSFVEVLLKLQNGTNLPNLDNVTYDRLETWIGDGWNEYNDVLMTNWPDLTPFKQAGGKVIHFHGESDYSIPTASSVRYWEWVREIMFPNMTYNASTEAINEFYRLFLVPGGSHCNVNSAEPNGPWPQTSLQNLIEWVEKDIVLVTLNGTVLQGENNGQNQQICGWPLRPFLKENRTVLECVYDQTSINTWHYDLNAFDMPVY